MPTTQHLDVIDLKRQLDFLTIQDCHRLRKRIHNINKMPNTQAQQSALIALQNEVEQAKLRVQQRKNSCPEIEYPADLPVVAKKSDIYQLIKNHQVVIIAGETGSGKTTQIPKICLELGRGVKGLIGHTQPRRLAARAVASRLADELHCSLGSAVGYKVRFSDQVGDNTLVKLMTDGILLAEIQQDRLLYQYDTIIIDEAHERSLNIDFILGYLRQILPKRPDLKVIITSATIDVERFSQHFNDAPVIEVSGRTYPVEVRYRPMADTENSDQLQAIFDAVDELTEESPGDILIFMSGEKEIRDTADALNKRNLRHTDILPLFARLSAAEQNRIFQPHTGRRIILATNVAETSLTVPGIKYVIDPGMARISRYSYRTKVQRLPIEPISQASANQRAGRCGRVSAGICIRLYDEQDFLSRPAFTDPEILRTNLASVILQMTALELGEISAFPFVQAPDNRHIQDGVRLLNELGALKENQRGHYQLTTIGKQLAQLPLDPRLGRMMIEARQQGCVHEIMMITSALSLQDPRERPLEKQQAADEKHRRFQDKQSDFMAFVNLWNYLKENQKALPSSQFRKLCRQDFLNYLRIREWQDIYTQLRQTVKELGFPINSEAADYRSIHLSLLSGLLSHVGLKDVEKHEYTGARNARFALYPNSGLFKSLPKWVIVSELVETTRLWGRTAAAVEPDWIEPLAQHVINRTYSEPHWSKKQGSAMAFEKVTLFGLPIVMNRKVNYSRIDPVLSRELFIRHAMVEGQWQTSHAFFAKNNQLLEEVEELEHKSRRRDIVVDEQTLFDFYDTRIPSDVVTSRDFDHWWKLTKKTAPNLLDFSESMLINEDANNVSAFDYPSFWTHGALKLPLIYQFEPGAHADGVTVQIPLPVLNQVEETGFDWQVPGLRQELIIALIKSLPKPLRRNLVPAPNYADAFLGRAKPLEGDLLDCLAREFRRMTGVMIEREDWRLDQVPDHLKVMFCVVDDKGQTIQESKDLHSLKTALADRVKETLSVAADAGIEQSGLHIWSFDELPQMYEQKQGHFSVKAYPAIIDEQDQVSIKLLETPQQQAVEMQKGVRRLLILGIPSPIKYLHEKLPNKAKLALHFNTFGTVLELIDDCICCAVDKLIQEFGGVVWEQEQFNQLSDFVRANLNETVMEIAQAVEQILTLTFAINKRLKGRLDMSMAFALSDIKAQLSQLIYKGFVTKTGASRLMDVKRYLMAIEKRMDKMGQDMNRDRANQLKIEHVQQEYQKLVNKLSTQPILDESVVAIRWMIEELRVNLFAQQIGTPYPISDKRILQQIDNI